MYDKCIDVLNYLYDLLIYLDIQKYIDIEVK